MKYCSNCGNRVEDNAKFCQWCGQALTAAVVPARAISNSPQEGVYSVVLADLGACTKIAAWEMLEDMLGYSVTQARSITDVMPVEVACNLNATQATYIAQAFAEYGMTASVYCGGECVDVSGNALESVFDSDGSFVEAVWTALSMLNEFNRVNNFAKRVKYDRYGSFAPKFRRPTPPPHVRRGRNAPPPPHGRPPRPEAPRPPRGAAPKPQRFDEPRGGAPRSGFGGPRGEAPRQSGFGGPRGNAPGRSGMGGPRGDAPKSGFGGSRGAGRPAGGSAPSRDPFGKPPKGRGQR